MKVHYDIFSNYIDELKSLHRALNYKVFLGLDIIREPSIHVYRHMVYQDFLMKGTHLSGTHDTLAVVVRIVKMTLGYC